jgi:PadR family transcriptional regulator PadR
MSTRVDTTDMDAIGPFEQAVLVALVRLRSDAYGRAILNEVRKRLDRDVSAGAVYATLERLEGKGLVSSVLAPGTAIRGGRPRRYFSLTGAGIRALNDAKTAADTLWHGLRWPLKVRI